MTPPLNVPTSQPRAALPDHLQLPETDGSIVENFQESPQGNLLTSSLLPRLRELHPDGQFCIGQDRGIYFKHTEPPLDGCRAPDWFYVPNVPPMLDGTFRRSYVLWNEVIRPFVVIEYASGSGEVERDRTPMSGKFWIYERAICAEYYAIFEIESGVVELHRLDRPRYAQVPPNERGRLPIPALGVELGVWQGTYRGIETSWLRVWDTTNGEMMPCEEERAEIERRRAEVAESLADDYRESLGEETERAEAARKEAQTAKQNADMANRRVEAALHEADEARQQRDAAKRQADEARIRADAAKQRADALAEKLRALGIDPEAA